MPITVFDRSFLTSGRRGDGEERILRRNRAAKWIITAIFLGRLVVLQLCERERQTLPKGPRPGNDQFSIFQREVLADCRLRMALFVVTAAIFTLVAFW